MAKQIALTTPDKWAKQNLKFRDWSLDQASLLDNCRILAEEFGREKILKRDNLGRTMALTPAEVLERSKAVVLGLTRITREQQQHRGRPAESA